MSGVSGQIDAFLSLHEYARDLHRQRLVRKVKIVLSKTNAFNWKLYASSSQKQFAEKLRYFIAESEDIVRQANDAFVKSEVAQYKKFFDSIESNPLTPAQCRACVVNEYNNLVLAGAGTGKTSTMIGRAGYLVASKRARPDQLLMLAYAKKAATEMQERQNIRLSPWMTDGSPKIKTFHALGLEIIGQVEGRRPDVNRIADDNHALEKFVDGILDQSLDDPAYRLMVVRYLGSEQYPYHNPFDFSSANEYEQYVRDSEIRTLKGEQVKSFEECVIANYLSANSVEYIYEHPYEIDTASSDFGQYKPDFYLPDYKIYIEHFALDQDGQPPRHFDQQKYIDGVTWKRELHAKHNTRLIETYSYLNREGCLESHLENCLQKAGVVLKVRPKEELLKELKDKFKLSDFSELISNILNGFKQANMDFIALRRQMKGEDDVTRLRLILDIFEPILHAYETLLKESGQIDFADMISKATHYIETGQYISPYTHILVDEFQDISKPRAQLINALLKQQADSILFAVGDDWQSIYRFSGGDLNYTRDFEKIFGATATTTLDVTFRFNNQISEVASKFILRNPQQIKKAIRSHTQESRPAVSVIKSACSDTGLTRALTAIEDIVNSKALNKASVLILGRYNSIAVDKQELPDIKRRHPSLDIKCMTVHAAKGKEADFVVVLGLTRGMYGFPCEKPTERILEYFLPTSEKFAYAEERRLFYVALTRARHRVYLVYNPFETSPFISELLDNRNGYQICVDEIKSEYNSECNKAVPVCPKCGGTMIERTGPHGQFWGCRNYHTNSAICCTYRINITAST